MYNNYLFVDIVFILFYNNIDGDVMKIVTLKREEFDEFASKHQYNSFYQSGDYAEFSKENDQYNYHFLGFVDNNNHLFGASLMLYKELFWGYKYAYSPRGLLIEYDNPKLITNVTNALKKLLKKQKFIFITIDPPIIASYKDKDGNTLKFNEQVNKILTTFKKNNYLHLGFNLYNESILPRWSVVSELDADPRVMYNNLSNEVKDKITYCNSISMCVKTDSVLNTNQFFEILKKNYPKKTTKYFQNIFTFFNTDSRVKIFYAVIDTKKYTENANVLYAKEEEKNNTLAEIIQSGDSIKYNMSKAINDKIISDKKLHDYKSDVISSTKMLKENPNGIYCAATVVIEETNGARILTSFIPKEYERYGADALLTYEIMKYYSGKGKQYLNLGAITGNFEPTSKYYSLLLSKIGFNSKVVEYIGQFDIILNPIMYKVYLRKK